MKLIIENIPKELHNVKQWVCWKKAINDKGKTTKIPINPFNGKNAMSNNPDTWSDVMEAVVGASKFGLDGIGFMFNGTYFGIDLDDCEDSLKNEFIGAMQSYTELSQSGNGIHIISKGKLPEGRRRVKGIEMYDSGRFFVMTGEKIGHHDITEGTERVIPLFNKYLAKKDEKISIDEEVAETLEPKRIRMSDTDLLKKAQNSRNGKQFQLLFDGEWDMLNYPSQSEADLALCNLLAFWTGKDEEQMDRIFRMSGLYRDKWDRKQSGTTYGRVTISTAVTNCKDVYNSSFKNETDIQVNSKTGEVAYKSKAVYGLNDTGNAQRFSDRFRGFVKFNFENHMWKIWNGKYWQNDVTNQIKNYAEVIIHDMKVDAFQTEEETERKAKMKNVERAYSSRGKEALLKEVQHAEGIPCVNSDFDNDEMLFNVENGVIDLTTGTLRPHEKSLMMSKIASYNYNGTKRPLMWLKFLDEVFQGDKELIDFIQKAVGYTLTGSIREQCMFILFGEGNNGKSVFLDIISKLLGDYAANATVDTILERKNSQTGATSDLARLKSARFVTTGENNEGSRINEGLIKQLTGGEKVTARFLYGIEFEYYPEFKLWIQTNHKPYIRGTDKGIWRRMRAVPFTLDVPEEKVDKDLVLKLSNELPSILAWAVEGALKWQKEGLGMPEAVRKATENYKIEMDVIATFLSEMCHEKVGWDTSANEMFKAYQQWARDGNEYLMSSTKFGKELAKRYPKERRSKGMVYRGIMLNKDDPDYTFNKDYV